MATLTLESMQQDKLVMAVARALAIANEAASGQGIDLNASLVSISEELSPGGRRWRVHYGPRDYVGRRGGDIIVLVDERTNAIHRIVRGQ